MDSDEVARLLAASAYRRHNGKGYRKFHAPPYAHMGRHDPLYSRCARPLGPAPAVVLASEVPTSDRCINAGCADFWDRLGFAQLASVVNEENPS